MMDKGVKQRLLGGVVLVAGAVLFLPYVFSGSGNGLPPRPEIPPAPQVTAADNMAPRLEQPEAAMGQAISAAHSDQDMVAAPPAPSAPPAPVAASAPPPPPATVVQAPAPAPQPAKPGKPKSRPEVAQVEPATPPAPAPAPENDKPAADGLPAAWVVQVASLSSEEKARELVAKLHKKGYHAAAHASGAYWKVTVGPELSRQTADSLRQKLAADPAFKLSGWVQSYHP